MNYLTSLLQPLQQKYLLIEANGNCNVLFHTIKANSQTTLTHNHSSYSWLGCQLDTKKVIDDARRYLETPWVFDTHYVGITRRRQAWTHFSFLKYTSNKDLHYRPGILRHPPGLVYPGHCPWVTSQLLTLLNLPIICQVPSSTQQQTNRELSTYDRPATWTFHKFTHNTLTYTSEEICSVHRQCLWTLIKGSFFI